VLPGASVLLAQHFILAQECGLSSRRAQGATSRASDGLTFHGRLLRCSSSGRASPATCHRAPSSLPQARSSVVAGHRTSLLTALYQFTMAYAYWKVSKHPGGCSAQSRSLNVAKSCVALNLVVKQLTGRPRRGLVRSRARLLGGRPAPPWCRSGLLDTPQSSLPVRTSTSPTIDVWLLVSLHQSNPCDRGQVPGSTSLCVVDPLYVARRLR
jgi:hypothetical protein